MLFNEPNTSTIPTGKKMLPKIEQQRLWWQVQQNKTFGKETGLVENSVSYRNLPAVDVPYQQDSTMLRICK